MKRVLGVAAVAALLSLNAAPAYAAWGKNGPSANAGRHGACFFCVGRRDHGHHGRGHHRGGHSGGGGGGGGSHNAPEIDAAAGAAALAALAAGVMINRERRRKDAAREAV